MNYTIFYSWQSDLSNNHNRSFILSALEKASRIFSQDKKFNVDTVIDRDTYGLVGSPSIVESITGKIAKSDIFVCDISIINKEQDGRKTPNPNVLYELGYASAILGWERIIMIQNTAYGNIEDLPFDLRGRRILQYSLDETIESKKEEKDKLKNNLFNTFKTALKHYSSEYIAKEKNIWWGEWENESKAKMKNGTLKIFRVASDSFFFNIDIYDGARTGDIFGKAKILTPNSAYAKINSFDDQCCELIFKRRLEGESWYIEIEESNACKEFHGFGTTFSGNYKHQSELVVDLNFIDEIDLNEITRLTGKYLDTFLNNFQQFGESQNFDDDDFYVISGGVKGFYTIMESILITDQKGNIWCAFIDVDIDAIRYFSNNSMETKTMAKWIENLGNKNIVKNKDNNQYDECSY
ncbi:TIR domain-containing protein [Myroides odoratimimus]|uniref:TIR domain-containing protein n=1 Tax=Myroides odoratimimus TaxID=76832 RepID=UPI00370AE772